jgi:hypothetical protein
MAKRKNMAEEVGIIPPLSRFGDGFLKRQHPAGNTQGVYELNSYPHNAQ